MAKSRSFQFTGPAPTGPEAPPEAPKPTEALKLTPAAETPQEPPTGDAEAPTEVVTPAPETPPATPPETPPETPDPKAPLVTEEELQSFQAEVMEKGELGEETLKSLEDRGIPRDLAVRVARSFQNDQAATVQSIQAEAGGADSYAAMQAWAKTNLPAEELTAFDKTLEAGDIGAIKTAVRGVYSKYTSVMGAPPALVEGRPTTAGVAGYRDQYEMVKEMRDPRYAKSEAFRQQVAARVAASRF